MHSTQKPDYLHLHYVCALFDLHHVFASRTRHFHVPLLLRLKLIGCHSADKSDLLSYGYQRREAQ
jgi:hypothetical protein